MSMTFLKIIGKKGRITIPHILRILYGIADNSVIKFEADDDRISIIPMLEFGNVIKEKSRVKVNLTEQQAHQMLENCSDETLKLLHSAVMKKLNLCRSESADINK